MRGTSQPEESDTGVLDDTGFGELCRILVFFLVQLLSFVGRKIPTLALPVTRASFVVIFLVPIHIPYRRIDRADRGIEVGR